MILEFLIPRRPLSQQANNRHLKYWIQSVNAVAAAAWAGADPADGDLRVTIVFLSKVASPDADNVIKPILDAMAGVVYANDSQIADVESHRRLLGVQVEKTGLPALLAKGVEDGAECVYVRVTESGALEDSL